MNPMNPMNPYLMFAVLSLSLAGLIILVAWPYFVNPNQRLPSRHKEIALIEITKEIAAVWSVIVGIFWAGISWGVVIITQRSFKKQMNDVSRWMRNMENRLGTDEQTYVKITDCKTDRDECKQNLAYHERQLLEKLADLKTYMVAMDAKREDTRKEITTQYTAICTDLAVLKRSVEHGPIREA